jgi:hypothetical protein
MELVSVVVARPSCNPPMPAHGLGSRPLARPCCYYSSAAARSTQSSNAVRSQGMGRSAAGDGVRRNGGKGTARRHDEGQGAVREGGTAGRTDEHSGNAQPRCDDG